MGNVQKLSQPNTGRKWADITPGTDVLVHPVLQVPMHQEAIDTRLEEQWETKKKPVKRGT